MQSGLPATARYSGRAHRSYQLSNMAMENELSAHRESGSRRSNGAVDYPFNDEFTSDRPEDVLRFYEHFRSRDELITWMRNRPSGRAVITEVEGRKDLIVVIPTADIHGPMATRCREEVFKGQHIVFVESGGHPDKFFNFARNNNIGVRRALEYSPKWIACANDDSYRVDPISTLVSGLEKLDPESTTIAFPVPFSFYHSEPASLVEIKRWARPLLRVKGTSFRLPYDIGQRLGVRFQLMANWIFNSGYRRVLYGPLIHSVASYVDTVSFGVYSARYIHNLNDQLFDEVYINSAEESDLALRTWMRRVGIHCVPFRMGDQVGMTLGTGLARALRSVASDAYLNYKIEHGTIDVSALPRRNPLPNVPSS